MNPTLLALLAFLAAVTTVAAGYSLLSDLFLRDRSRVSRRVDVELNKRQRERVKRSALFKNVGAAVVEVAAAEEDNPGPRQRFEMMLEQSGLDLAPRRLLLYMAAAGLALGTVGGLLGSNLIAAAAAALAGAAVPYLYVYRRRQKRLNRIMAQLPDAFDLMARVIRAGQTMSQALQAVADEFDPPLAPEFAYCYEQQNLGLSSEVALRDLARRTGLLEIKIFVLALLVQQQAGGNLAELLDNLAAIIRERFKIRGKIKTLTAEGRVQAAVLLALPPAMFLLILLLNRNYGQALIDHPALLIGTLASELVGALWIRKIVNFDF